MELRANSNINSYNLTLEGKREKGRRGREKGQKEGGREGERDRGREGGIVTFIYS